MGLNIKAATVLAGLVVSLGGVSSASAGSANTVGGVEAPPVVNQQWPVYRHRHPFIIPYYKGYPGLPKWRAGYRRHANGWWYPLAAFGVQVIIRQPKRHRRTAHGLPPEHYVWCDRRYRSYRVWDDTFQPYHGPRQLCNSPYDGR